MVTRDFRGVTYTVKAVVGDCQAVRGTALDDWIEFIGGNNIVRVGQGNDVVLAGVTFGGIEDNFLPYNGPVIIYDGPIPNLGNKIDTGEGDDYVASGAGDSIVNLGNGNNIFDGAGFDSNNQIFSGSGNDVIFTGNGNQIIKSGGGDDQIYLTAGNSSVFAGLGNDVVTTSRRFSVNESASGLELVKSYIGAFGGEQGDRYQQVVNAGGGDNQIALLVFGETQIRTGPGQDFVLAAAASRLVGSPVNTDSVDIITGSGDDTVITLSTRSSVRTGAGDDLIFGGRGDDTINAGSGQNVIVLGGETVPIPSPLSNLSFTLEIFGKASAVVGEGNDTVYLGGGDNIVVLGSNSFATMYGFGSGDQLDISGVANVSFTRSGRDTLINSDATSVGILRGFTGTVTLA
jgi:Ca2+-binding RTX toxin-like protein